MHEPIDSGTEAPPARGARQALSSVTPHLPRRCARPPCGPWRTAIPHVRGATPFDLAGDRGHGPMVSWIKAGDPCGMLPGFRMRCAQECNTPDRPPPRHTHTRCMHTRRDRNARSARMRRACTPTPAMQRAMHARKQRHLARRLTSTAASIRKPARLRKHKLRKPGARTTTTTTVTGHIYTMPPTYTSVAWERSDPEARRRAGQHKK